MESEAQTSVSQAAGRYWKSQAFAFHRLEVFLFPINQCSQRDSGAQ